MPKKSTKQKTIVKACPLMSRKVTFMDYGEERSKFVRQACIGDDCELWDPNTPRCSLAKARRLHRQGG